MIDYANCDVKLRKIMLIFVLFVHKKNVNIMVNNLKHYVWNVIIKIKKIMTIKNSCLLLNL